MNRHELESLQREAGVVALRTLAACQAGAIELERLVAHAQAAARCAARFMDALAAVGANSPVDPPAFARRAHP